MVFPVVMYGCESWTIKKVECWRIEAFELWCWRRLLRVPWTARRSNQSIPKGNQFWIFIGRTGAEAEVPILRPPDVNSQLIGKDPNAGKDWRQKEKGRQRIKLLDSITDSVDMNLSEFQEITEKRGTWCAAVHRVSKRWTWLFNWATTNLRKKTR